MFIKHGFARVLMLLYAVALLAACAGLGAYRESPRASLVSIEPLDMTLLEQRYALQLRIINPNDADMPINGLSYTIEINQR